MNTVKLLMAASAVALLGTAGCSRVAPDQGQAAVLIRKPMIFGHGGVVNEPVITGVTYAALTTNYITINMQPQLFNTEFDNIMTKDGVPVTFQMRLTLQVTDPVALVEHFSGADFDGPHANDWYKINIAPHLQYLIRTAAKQYPMNDLAISGSAADEVDAYVRKNLLAYIAAKHIPVKVVDVNAGRADPPDSVKTQRIQTATEQQRQITERQTQLAEEARKGAEEARAIADKAYNDKMQISSEQYIALERIKMMRAVCTMGNNCYFFTGNTPQMMLNK